MIVDICTNKTSWNHALISLGKAEFLQSWEWGEFQKDVGHLPVRLLVEKMPIQGFLFNLPLGFSFVYFPRIPHLSQEMQQAIVIFLKKEGYVFARFEPAEGQMNGTKPVHCRQPQTTLLLDLSQSEDELLAGMHAKTRYNMRLAEKKGVTITHKKDSDTFWQLNTETTARDEFKSHDKAYYQHMIASDLVEQYTAWHDGAAIATILCVRFHDQYVYLHGASSNTKRNLMAPYLLQWHAIQDAKRLGCTTYDFWGIAPQGGDGDGPVTTFNGFTWRANHPWTGVTRFKVGFGGMVKRYPAASEIPLKRMVYTAINLVKKIR